MCSVLYKYCILLDKIQQQTQNQNIQLDILHTGWNGNQQRRKS